MPLTDTLNTIQTSRHWATVVCFAALGALVLFCLVSKTFSENPESLQAARSFEKPIETIHTPVPITSSNPNVAVKNVEPRPVASRQSNPFKAYLDSHESNQLSIASPPSMEASQPVAQNPFKEALKRRESATLLEENPPLTQNPFAESLKNRQPYSVVSPFATLQNTNSTNRRR